MAPPQGNGGEGMSGELDGDTEADRTENGTEAERTENALKKLWSLCNVLGITYQSKMDEFGSVINTDRVVEAVKFLEVSKINNFNMLKQLAREMSDAWKKCNTQTFRIEKFCWILPILNAKSAEDIWDWNMLSTKAVHNAKAEVTKLTNDWDSKMKRKYTAKLSKLKKMLAETHMRSDEFGLDLNKQVNAKDYKDDKDLLKCVIKCVKETSAKRQIFVLRVEMAKRAMNRKLPLDDIKDLLMLAKKEAALLEGDEPVMYDGKNVEEVLDNMEKLAVEAQRMDLTKEKEVLSRTRSGRVL